MNIQQPELTDVATAQQLFEDKQVNLFLFDLKNEATERGFKSDNPWTLQLASAEEMAGLKRLHFPVVSLRLQSNSLLNIFKRVKSQLKQVLSETELAIATADINRDDKSYIAAYPTKVIVK